MVSLLGESGSVYDEPKHLKDGSKIFTLNDIDDALPENYDIRAPSSLPW